MHVKWQRMCDISLFLIMIEMHLANALSTHLRVVGRRLALFCIEALFPYVAYVYALYT